MNRFIDYTKKSSSAPFLISIYRDYRTFSSYGAVCYSTIRLDRRVVKPSLQKEQIRVS